MADKRSSLDQMMRDHDAWKKRHEHWEQMDPWEKDREERYAGDETVVNEMVVPGMIPVIGMSIMLALYSAWDTIGKSWTGIGHRAKRTGDVIFVVQVIELFLLLIVVFV